VARELRDIVASDLVHGAIRDRPDLGKDQPVHDRFVKRGPLGGVEELPDRDRLGRCGEHPHALEARRIAAQTDATIDGEPAQIDVHVMIGRIDVEVVGQFLRRARVEHDRRVVVDDELRLGDSDELDAFLADEL
jgi:hypothetical protein